MIDITDRTEPAASHLFDLHAVIYVLTQMPGFKPTLSSPISCVRVSALLAARTWSARSVFPLLRESRTTPSGWRSTRWIVVSVKTLIPSLVSKEGF